MNVFESLIEELKKEQLIEEDIVDTTQSVAVAQTVNLAATPESLIFAEDSQISETMHSEKKVADASPISETEFYRRRAMEEVTSLQMVEHIFSGVERDQMKIIPNTYDSLSVSTALHEFLQVTKNFNSPENAAAEFTLMQETESWYSALSYRDRNILPVHLRRYCETVKPGLSVQAVASLTRFYRNSPYSESVRSKFDMVVTRLFSREGENDERELAFESQEIVQHLSELYADWASVSIYATDDDSKINEIVGQFRHFIREAESANQFEDLIKSDFFNRVRAYKEESGENFYAPQITATVIECNIRVGNVYVRLLQSERQLNGENLENKYGYLLDQAISETTSKTLRLTSLLEERNLEQFEEPETENLFEAKSVEASPEENAEKAHRQSETSTVKPRKVNKFVVLAGILAIMLVGALYFWTQATEPEPNRQGVETFQLDGHYFKDYLKVAKITNDNFIGIINPNWDNVSDDKKREVLKNIILVGTEKGFHTVRLQTIEGKTVGYATGDNITISN